jgi:hypothetical protein
MRKYSTTTLAVGDVVAIELPGSEVCVHMRVAGKTMSVRVLADGMAQLLTETGEPFSFPVTWGEAGIYRDALGAPYLSTYTDQADVPR